MTFDRQRLDQLRMAMTRWMGARSLSPAEFAERFVAPSTSGAAIDKLRTAAEEVRVATTHGDLAEASAALAGAMREIGLEKWSRFLGDAAERAEANGSAGRKVVLAQVATPNQATDASSGSGPDTQKNQELADYRKRFDAATAAAYQQYSHDCSHYLQTFLKRMGVADARYRTANEFMNEVQQKVFNAGVMGDYVAPTLQWNPKTQDYDQIGKGVCDKPPPRKQE